MCDKALIVKRALIKFDLKRFLRDLQNLFHQIRKIQCVADIGPIFRIDKMQGDKPGFVFRHIHPKPLFDQFHRILSQTELLRIKLLDLPEQRVLRFDPLTDPLDREIDMIRQRHINTLVQTEFQLFFRISDNIIRDRRMFKRHICQQFF